MNITYSFLVTSLAGLSTLLGMCVIFFKNKDPNKVIVSSLSFAAGVMIAASVWSLIIPSVEMAENQGKIEWIPAAVGLLLGVLFLIFISNIVINDAIGSTIPDSTPHYECFFLFCSLHFKWH